MFHVPCSMFHVPCSMFDIAILIDAQFQATGPRREKMGTSVDETPVKIVHKHVYVSRVLTE